MKWNNIKETPIPEREGTWLVCFNKSTSGSKYHTFIRKKTGNGSLTALVAGHFAFDFLDDNYYIVAWAEFPEYIEYIE